MEFNYFDIIVTILILFLGLKGVLNGFFKEFFGFIGIIGGIFIASRIGDDVGKIISDTIFKFQNSAAINFTGFLVTLASFWLFMVGVGMLFKKLSSISGLGVFDKILGFIFSAGKFFLIASVIFYASYNIKAVKANIDSWMQNSALFGLFIEAGGFIMKLEPINITDNNLTITMPDTNVTLPNMDDMQDSAIKILEDTKKKINEQIEQNVSNGAKR
ncbi:MAG: rane protein required for colicin production [Campylobacterota bacterium]|nr:rane protein required for colicin production [Campylobacterota bacterium]